jgi:hypothetical protein
MADMDVWDWVLFGGAAFVAVTSLVILMLRHRDEGLADLEAQRSVEQGRQRHQPADEKQQQQTKRAA